MHKSIIKNIQRLFTYQKFTLYWTIITTILAVYAVISSTYYTNKKEEYNKELILKSKDVENLYNDSLIYMVDSTSVPIYKKIESFEETVNKFFIERNFLELSIVHLKESKDNNVLFLRFKDYIEYQMSIGLTEQSIFELSSDIISNEKFFDYFDTQNIYSNMHKIIELSDNKQKFLNDILNLVHSSENNRQLKSDLSDENGSRILIRPENKFPYTKIIKTIDEYYNSKEYKEYLNALLDYLLNIKKSYNNYLVSASDVIKCNEDN